MNDPILNMINYHLLIILFYPVRSHGRR